MFNLMRAIQSIIIWVAVFGWIVVCVYVVDEVGVSVWESFGMGAGLGVLLAMLKDMWQFMFRKKGTTEKQ